MKIKQIKRFAYGIERLIKPERVMDVNAIFS